MKQLSSQMMPYLEPNLGYEYQVGGSLRIDAPSYVIRQADSALYEALRIGTFCYVFNARQMGKSSLRVRAMHQLKAEGYTCISLDMTRIGSEYLSPHQWYERIVSELWRGAMLSSNVDLRGWLNAHPDLSLAQLLDRFIAEVLLAHVSERIVIFIDEIDSLLGLDFSVNDFFALIRACYNQRVDDPTYERLTFCLLGVATPSDLIQDKTRTPFNIGKAIDLQGFRPAEAKPLAQGLVGHVQSLKTAFLEILQWTGGQPFLTQKVCQLVVEAAEARHQPLTIAAIRQVIQERIIQNWESQDEPEHLRTIRDRLLRHGKQANQMLGLYQQILQTPKVSADDSEGQMELRLSGLVVKRGEQLMVHTPIYAAVFDLHWVRVMLDQLRPYAETFNAWVTSGGKDDSRLLRGKALEEALQWSAGRPLSSQDSEFLRASQHLENQETKQANQILNQASRKAKRRLTFSTTLLGITLLLTGGLSLWTTHSIQQARLVTRLERESNNTLAQFEFNQTQALLAAMQSAHELKQRSQCWLVRQRQPWTSRRCLIPKFWQQGVAAYPTSAPILTLQEFINQIRQQDYIIDEASIQFTTQGERILDFGGRIRVWDSAGKQLASFDYKGFNPTGYAQLSPDGQYVLIVGAAEGDTDHNTVQLTDLQGKQLAWIDAHDGRVEVIRFTPDSRRFLLGDSSGKVTLWDLQGNLLATLGDQQGPIFDAQFSPDGKFALIHRGNGVDSWNHQTAQLWDVQGNQTADFSTEEDEWISAAQFSPNGQLIATADDGGMVHLWNLQGTRLTTFKAHESTVAALTFSPDNQKLLTGGDTTARLWDIQGTLLQQFDSSGQVHTVQFSPDGQLVATGGANSTGVAAHNFGRNGAVRVWDLQGNPLTTFWHESPIYDLQFSPNGQKIAASVSNWLDPRESIMLHLSGETVRQSTPSGQVSHVHLHPGAQHITTVDTSGAIYLWNRNGERLTHLREPQAESSTVGFGPVRLNSTGDSIFVQSQDFQQDHVTRLLDTQGRLLKTFPGLWSTYWHRPVSPGGKHIATLGSSNTVQIWDAQGNLVGETPTIVGHIQSLDFSPKGDRFLTTGGHGIVRLWNLQGEELASLKAHPDWVNAAYFINDGAQIIIFTEKVQIWNVAPSQDNLSTLNISFFPDLEYTVRGRAISNLGIFSPQSRQLMWVATDEADLARLLDLDTQNTTLLQGNHGWFQGNMERNSDAMQFSEQGDRIATLGEDGYVRVWDNAGNHLAEYEGYQMALSKTGDEIVVVSRENHVPEVQRVDDLEGLLQRGCDWLRPYLEIHPHTPVDDQICSLSP